MEAEAKAFAIKLECWLARRKYSQAALLLALAQLLGKGAADAPTKEMADQKLGELGRRVGQAFNHWRTLLNIAQQGQDAPDAPV